MLVQERSISSFAIFIKKKGILLQAADKALEQELPLPEDVLQSLRSFFYGMPSIAYMTYDYTSLKSFVNAWVMLDELLSNRAA